MRRSSVGMLARKKLTMRDIKLTPIGEVMRRYMVVPFSDLARRSGARRDEK